MKAGVSQAAIRRPRTALALLGAVLAVLALLATGLESRLTPTTLYTPGTESARAAAIYNAEFGDGITIPVLLEGPAAELDRQGPALVRRLRAKPDLRILSAWDRGPAGSSLRPKPGAALIVVGVDRPLEQAVDAGYRAVAREVEASVSAPVEPHVTGLAAIGLGVKDASLSAVARAEKIAVPILLLVLLAVFRSVVAAMIPAVFGGAVVVAGSGVLSLLTRVTDIDAIAVSLASMMGLALGVDYSLLMVSRFREELAEGKSAVDAARATSVSAGRTVRFAGAVLAAAMGVTLLIAPGELLVSATLGVLSAVLVSVSVAAVGLPAVLVLLGPRVDRLWIGRRRTERRSTPVRAAVAVLRRPLVPALALRTGPPDVRALPKDSPVREDYEAVRRAMGPGWSAPFEVMVRVPDGAITDRSRLERLQAWQRRVSRWDDVQGVVGPGAIAARLPDVDLDEAASQLASGRRDLKRLQSGLGRAGDGVRELRTGLAEAADASAALAAGGQTARDGAERVRSGIARAAGGAGTLASGLATARDGGRRLDAGASRTARGAARLARSLASTQGRVERGLADARALPAGLRDGAAKLGKLREPAQKTEAELRKALKALDGFTLGKADPRYAEAYTAVATALGAASGRNPITGLPVQPGYDGLDPSLARASAELGRAADGADRLVAGSQRLATGLGELAAGARKLRAGADRLARGTARLRRGLARLADGGGELRTGLEALQDGAGRLGGGLDRLAGGAGRLRGGLENGAERTGELRAGLRRGERGLARSDVGAEVNGLARSASRSPGLFDSGYFTLAALDGAKRSDRASAQFAVSLDRGGRAGRVMVISKTGPNEDATARLNDKLQRATQDLARSLGGQAAVGGAASFLDDYDRVTASRFPWLVIGIVLASFFVLVPVFRSLLLPVIAIALNLLTVGAAFGILALLFQDGGPFDEPGFIDAVSASGIFCTLFGLSIDYQVFLITRMREGWDSSGDTRDAIAFGLERTASVVTGAAAIMLGVFSAFALADVASIRQFGIGLAVAVLIDATVVRLVLLPAAMRACGRWCWWLPAPLERRLPRLTLE